MKIIENKKLLIDFFYKNKIFKVFSYVFIKSSAVEFSIGTIFLILLSFSNNRVYIINIFASFEIYLYRYTSKMPFYINALWYDAFLNKFSKGITWRNPNPPFGFLQLEFQPLESVY